MAKTRRELTASDDSELLAEYAKGDYRAFQEIYRRYSPRVFGYLKKRLGGTDNLEEMFNSIFLNLHYNRCNLKINHPLESWLFVNCRVTLREHLENQMSGHHELGQSSDQLVERVEHIQIEENILDEAIKTLIEPNDGSIQSDFAIEEQEEFLVFMSNRESPSLTLSTRVKEEVFNHLHPSPWLVLVKFIFFQFIGGAASVVLCPQFGLSYHPLPGIFSWALSANELIGIAFSGAFFMSTGSVIATFIMSAEERTVFQSLRWILIPLTASLFLSFLEVLSGNVMLDTAIVWWLGAVLSGIVIFDLIDRLKRQLNRKNLNLN